jgi:hypothetical protein
LCFKSFEMNVGLLISLVGSLKEKNQPNESRAKKAPCYSHEHHEEEKSWEYENAFMTMVEKC